MSFSFLSIDKIKNMGTLNSKYNHNCRLVDVSNAIPELYEENEDIIPLPERNGMQLSYADAIKERISSLDYYKTHSYRKDAVLAYDMVLTFSKNDSIDIEEWKQKTKEWIEKEFNVAPDGRSNVLHLVFHGDEVGNAHCHALVCPIDENGRLNARRFTGGSRKLTNLQTSYADSVKSLGLERGIYASSAHHKNIRRLYAEVNNAIKIPEKKADEPVSDYIERIKDTCQTWKAATKKQLDDEYRKKRQIEDKKRNQDRELIKEENEKTQRIALYNLSQINAQKETAKREKTAYEKQVEELKNHFKKLHNISNITELVEAAKRQKQLETGLSAIKKENEDDGIAYEGHIRYVMTRGAEYGLTEQDTNIHNLGKEI